MGAEAVLADTEEGDIEAIEQRFQIAKAARLLRTSGGIVPRIKIKDYGLPRVIIQPVYFSVAPFELEGRRQFTHQCRHLFPRYLCCAMFRMLFVSRLTSHGSFPTDAIHRTAVDRFLDQLFGITRGVEDFRQIVIIHAEHTGGGGHAKLATYAGILVNMWFSHHYFLLVRPLSA
jgi:hypothetical protein